MIELEIPRDIRKYEAKLFGPFTTRQLVCFVIAAVIALAAYFVLADMMPQDICFFVIIIIDLPLLLCGWVKPYGMPFEKFAKTAFTTTFVSPAARKYVTENAFAEKTNTENAGKSKKSVKTKPSKDKNLVAYK
jgi:hypothetical protein